MGEKLTLLKKIASAITRIKHKNVPKEYFYFYRDTYVCKLLQAKFFFKDHIQKNKYKVINFSGEFAPELQFALPHAYWHYKNGTLAKTISSPGTKELYFFSENHEEAHYTRNNEGNYNFEVPRVLYSHDYNMSKWLPVPLKEQYKNDVYKYEKPILIIANRYNMEWDGPPISFFSIEVLDALINMLKEKYTIIYNRPNATQIVNDNSEIYDLNEIGWLKEQHPEVILLNELFEENKIGARNFNHFQLCVYANAENFLSTHGGTAALASYFGGMNIILSKKGPEHHFHCYQKLYPQLSGAEIFHAKTDEDLLNYANKLF